MVATDQGCTCTLGYWDLEAKKPPKSRLCQHLWWHEEIARNVAARFLRKYRHIYDSEDLFQRALTEAIYGPDYEDEKRDHPPQPLGNAEEFTVVCKRIAERWKKWEQRHPAYPYPDDGDDGDEADDDNNYQSFRPAVTSNHPPSALSHTESAIDLERWIERLPEELAETVRAVDRAFFATGSPGWKTMAANQLGISRPTLQRRIDKLSELDSSFWSG